MSFSYEIKKELASHSACARHCQIAELSAIISYAGKIVRTQGDARLKIETGNSMLLDKFKLLLSKIFSMEKAVEEITGSDVLRVLECVKMWDARKECFFSMETVNALLIQQACCKRAFIRGAFLACGSMSNPGKSYHFEIVCRTRKQAQQLKDVMDSFDVDARIVVRKKNQVVYVKEGSHIVDLLNIMEAHEALMNLENVRIVKEMRNSVNRRVNCETANISKTVTASVRQIEDIEYIRNRKGLESLPDHLREAAALRLEYPDMPLKELGTCFSPPVGKSGVNHRLRRISQIAAELRENDKEVAVS